MKRIMACMIALALLLTGALAEEGFGFHDGIAWGMSAGQVLAAEGDPDAERDSDAGFDSLEIENVERYGGMCDLEYFFRNDALVACACEYEADEDGIGFEPLKETLTGVYGQPLEGDTERWQLLEDILDGEMELRATDSYASWELADGTFIALVEDARDAAVSLCFYNETAIIETAL